MFDRVHARARAKAGRVATAAGAAVLTGGLFTDFLTGPGIAAAATTAGIGLATNIKLWKAPSSAKATAFCVYASPHAGNALLLVGERLVPSGSSGWLLAQVTAIAVWTGATWYIRPGRLARDLVDEAVLQEIAEATKEAEQKAAEVVVRPVDPSESDAARWWRQEFAGEDGIAPNTVLLDYDRISDECVAVVLGSAQRGTPVPDISKSRLSAHLDVPEEQIEIGPVPGRGAGVRLLVLGPRPEPAESEKTAGGDEEVWKEIAATAMPGVELIEANTYEIRKELT
ncbi:hypothetical protein [Streptomyces sp. NPDC002535]